MNLTTFVALVNNAALLLVLSVIFEVVYLIPVRLRRLKPLLDGVFIALICVVIMSRPYVLTAGLVFDTRSILISVTALVFGPVPTLITVLAALAYRIFLGGVGVLPGLCVIVESALIGLMWRRLLHPKARLRWLNVYLMSVAVHVAMLALMFLLPYPDGLHTVKAIAVPVLVIYPVASTLLCLLLLGLQATKRIQGQLKQSEERFRTLFTQAPLGYQSLDAEGNLIEVNEQWLAMLGYTREEVIGKWFGSFLTPSCRDAFRSRFSLFKAQGHIHSEFEMLCKDGMTQFIAFEGKIGRDAKNDFVQTHCILQNITEQKDALNKLHASEENYRRLFETMAQGVVYQTDSGEIVSANPMAERILGLSLEQMRGKTSGDPIWKIIREDGSAVEGADHPSMIALRTGKPCGPAVLGVFRQDLKDYVWLSIYAMPLFRPAETAPYQAYAIFQDITNERRARQDYQLLFREMLDGFALHEVICDGQGRPVDYRFLAVNPAFESMTGLKAEQIVGKTVLEVMPGTEPYWIETYGQVALTGEPVQFENYSAETGKYFAVSAYQAKQNQFACTFTDITDRILAEKEARDNLFRLIGLLRNSPGPIMIIDRRGDCVAASSSLTALLDRQEDAILGRHITLLMPPRIAERVLGALADTRTDHWILQDVDEFELHGEKCYFENRIFPIPGTAQNEPLLGFIGIDVTERMLAAKALKESQERYSSYIMNAPDGIVILDENGRFVEVNDAAVAISGFDKEKLLALSIAELVAEGSADVARKLFDDLLKNGSARGELLYRHQDGTTRWAKLAAIRLSDRRFLSFMSDITAQKEAEQKLIDISNHDYLTGLYNRMYFDQEEKRFQTPDQLPLSIVIGDINGLKIINDSFGRAEGDAIIMHTAKFLSEFCRPGDILAKTGGDEFSLLLPRTSRQTAAALIRKIQETCRKHRIVTPNESYQISLSFGIGTKDTEAEDMTEVYKKAEDDMSQHKLLEKKSSHSAIISSIQAAMLEKSHETEAHSERLIRLVTMMGTRMALSQTDLDHLVLLATLHDIGKIGISEQILKKPGRLDDHEWQEMKKHPEIGARIALSTVSFAPIADYILSHHERWDGKGYPQGLAGSEIPLLSRILAVADAYDAMTQDRIYRKAMPHQDAIEEIRKNAGAQFDPQIALLFCDTVPEILP